jgi:predicted nuclease with TOPRIM domain
MSENITDVTQKILRAIQEEMSALRHEFQKELAVTARKLGAISESLNSIRVEQHKQAEQLAALPNHMQSLAIAVDEHTHRLGSVEDRLISIDQKLHGH